MTKILIDEATVKLALEALMRSRKAVSGDLDLAGCAYGKNDPDGHRYTDAKTALVTLDKAITALREALAGNVKETQKIEHEPAQQCWKCGDMDAAFQAQCNVPACGMKEQPAQHDIQRLNALVRAQQITIDKLEAQRKPLTEQMMTKTALWDLVVSKGLVTIHSEQLAPGTWSAHLSVASWIEGHAKSCDISNEAAHGIKENT